MTRDGAILEDLDVGTEVRLNIECSKQTRKEVKRVLADVNPEMTYEELLHAVIRAHQSGSVDLQKHHY